MTSPRPGDFRIAGGFLEVSAETDRADRTVRGFLARSLTRFKVAERAWQESGEESGEKFGEGVTTGVRRELGRGIWWNAALQRFQGADGKIISAGEAAGKAFGRGMGDGIEKEIGGGGGRGFFRSIFAGLSNAFSGGINQLRELGSTLRDVGQVFATAGGFIGALLKITLIAAAIPVILALGGALIDLVGILAILPGTIGVLIAIIAPLIIAFQGFGTAVSALMSGDLDALNEALKGLAPSARKVVRELGAVLPLLKGIKGAVQEAFFAPLVGQLKIAAQDVLPSIRAGLISVSGALGRVTSQFLQLFHDTDMADVFEDLFASTARIVDRVGPALVNLFGTLMGVMEHGLPFVERMFGGMARGMEKFAGFLSDAMADGRFQQWLERAFSVMTDLWNVTKAFGNVLMALMGDAGDEGQGFLRSVTDALNRFAHFLRSDEGREALQRMLEGVKLASVLVAGFFLLLANLARFSNFINDLFIEIKEFFTDSIPNAFNKSIDAIGSFFSSIGQFFVGIGRSIMDFLTTAGRAVIDFFVAMPGRIMDGLMMLPGLVLGFFDSMLHQTAFNVGMFVGIIVGYFMDLPGRIANAFTTLVNLIRNAFFQARDNAINTVVFTIAAVVGYIQALPGRMAAAASTLWSSISTAFFALRDGATRAVTVMIQSVVNLITSLRTRAPQAASDAGSWLYNAGRNMIEGLVNGITSLLGWAVNKAKSIAKSIADGFKKGLGIDSPSKVMRDEVGRWILPGVMEGIEAGLPRLRKMVGGVSSSMPQMATAGVTNVTASMGPVMILADFGDGVRQVVQGVIVGQPRTVAAAADEGNRQRSRVNTARARM